VAVKTAVEEQDSSTDSASDAGEAAQPEDETAEEPVAEEEAAEPITLTYLVDDGEADQLIAHTLADAYMQLHPNVTIEIENRPQGGDGDNVVKTRLATGEMTDVFWYNAGSLLQALNPSETLVDLSNEPFMDNVDDAFKQTVSQKWADLWCAKPVIDGRWYSLQQAGL
jgi:raffinose/stachyose/melibiose transport system substrate-binding protein